jgi:hypothetical protein
MKKICLLMSLLLLVPAALSAQKISIGPADFMDPGDDADAMGIGGWCEFVYKDTQIGSLYAPVHFPDNVVIKNVRLVYSDTDAGNEVTCSLVRRNKFSGETKPLFSCPSSGYLAGIRSSIDSTCVPASDRLVNNGACTYFINLYFNSFGSALQVYSVTIIYE